MPSPICFFCLLRFFYQQRENMFLPRLHLKNWPNRAILVLEIPKLIGQQNTTSTSTSSSGWVTLLESFRRLLIRFRSDGFWGKCYLSTMDLNKGLHSFSRLGNQVVEPFLTNRFFEILKYAPPFGDCPPQLLNTQETSIFLGRAIIIKDLRNVRNDPVQRVAKGSLTERMWMQSQP